MDYIERQYAAAEIELRELKGKCESCQREFDFTDTDCNGCGLCFDLLRLAQILGYYD